MTEERIARILYNMCLDMDYADNLEHAEDEIQIITDGIHNVYKTNISLYNALEIIALKNENIEHWKDNVSL